MRAAGAGGRSSGVGLEPGGQPGGTASTRGPVRITVAICTYNRCALLERTLSSLARAAVPDRVDWEVLVVDNRCTDRTPAVVRHFRDALPVRRLEEPRPGLSHARNRAVAAASGDYVVWTDDDVRVDPGWIVSYAEAFERWPEAGFFGGPIRPHFEGEPPRWLTDGWEEVRGAYPVRELGDEPFAITRRARLPYGANFAVPAEIQARHRFDPRLGRSGTDLVGGEETELLGSLLDEDRTGRWVPGAGLDHRISARQQTIAYLRRYYRDFGRLCELRRRRRRDRGGAPELWGRPRWAWRSALTEEIRFRLLRPLAQPARWLPALREASRARGILEGPPDRAERRRAGVGVPT